jgi:GDP-4-dehydro-6-deoxy-D-mannose reductase
MKAFITGITGFAGSFLAEHLLAAGDEVLGASRSGRWVQGTPETVRRSAPVVAWDLGKLTGDEAIRERLRNFQPEVIYHLAALSVPDDCGPALPTPLAGMVNIGGAERIAELALSLAHPPRLVFVSTSHVYAPVTPDRYIVDESAPLEPRGGYGASKLAGESLVLRMHAERGLNVVVARSFQHTGPRQEARLMLPSWARQFVAGEKPVKVYNLDTWLDLSDVRDIVRAYRLLAKHGESGGIYNIGSGRRTRSGDVFDELRRQADPSRASLELQGGARQNWIANNRRLIETTGWQPEIPLPTTVADTLAYWREVGPA